MSGRAPQAARSGPEILLPLLHHCLGSGRRPPPLPHTRRQGKMAFHGLASLGVVGIKTEEGAWLQSRGILININEGHGLCQ